MTNLLLTLSLLTLGGALVLLAVLDTELPGWARGWLIAGGAVAWLASYPLMY